MSRLSLDNNMLAEEYFEDAQLIGIQCALPPQRLVWQINTQFQYEFLYYPTNDIKLLKKGRQLVYPVFMCTEPRFALEHIFYTNQQQGEYLLPELKHFDFIWMLKTERAIGPMLLSLIEEIKTMDRVQVALEIDRSKIQHKKHLVL